MVRLRNPPSSQGGSSQMKPPRKALREKTNTSRRYENDGEVENLVKDAKHTRGRSAKHQDKEDEYMMAGALSYEATASKAEPVSASVTKDGLTTRNAPPTTTSAFSRRPPRTFKKVVQNEAQTKVLEGLKQRMAAAAEGQRTNRRSPIADAGAGVPSSDSQASQNEALRKSGEGPLERSKLSISPSPPPSGNQSSLKRKRPSLTQTESVIKVHSTPAIDSSVLALKNFKRRPRQPSMLQMVQQRTASARPSMTNEPTDKETSVSDLEHDLYDFEHNLDDEDDFAPEAEGTPLHVGSARPQALISSSGLKASGIWAGRKRKSAEAEHSTSVNPKRRKSVASDDMEDNIIVSLKPRPSAEYPRTTGGPSDSDRQVIISSSPTSTRSSSASHEDAEALEEEVVVPSTGEEQSMVPSAYFTGMERISRHEDDIVSTGTMAEPADSSSPPDQLHRSQQHNHEPLSQRSPTMVQSKRQQKKMAPMSTATLQSLLPRRRKPLKPRPRKTEYDIGSESEDEVEVDVTYVEGEDEYELSGVQRRRKKTETPKTKKRASHAKGRQSRVAPSTAKPKAPASRKTATQSQKSKQKTYGRGTTSDKENETDEPFEEAEESTLPEVSISMEEAVQSRELEDAKRKFADVDDWDMEFESMSADDHRDSSQSWR